METEELKLCIDCNSFRKHPWVSLNAEDGSEKDDNHFCTKYAKYYSLVTGEKRHHKAKTARQDVKLCGPLAVGFEAKPVKVDPPKFEPGIESRAYGGCELPGKTFGEQPQQPRPVKISFWRKLWPL